MRTISIVVALVIALAISKVTHQFLATPVAAAVDLLIFIVAFITVSRSIKSYLDE